MTAKSINLPYFDLLLGEAGMRKFRTEIGFWASCALGLLALPAPENGLDVGCGFDATIASLNENFSGMQLVGLNIDSRQLLRARKEVKASPGNFLCFGQGNACVLPFSDQFL